MTRRYYQSLAFDSTMSYMSNGGRRGLIVIPTGAGKSFVQADLTQACYHEGARILLLTHQAELIKQNYAELHNLMPMVDAGIYSAGMGLRHTENRVLFAGIQSVYKKALHLGRFDIVMIDEVHLVPQKNEGTYRRFLDMQFKMNPHLVLIGLTATPYRLRGGHLTYGEDRIFTDIIHETTISELMTADNPDGKQYLSTLISKRSAVRADLSGVKLIAGDYNQGQMETAFDKIVEKSVRELLEYTQDRKKVLIFASGIKHAKHIASLIPGCGILHSQESGSDFDKFKRGEIKYLVNVAMATTGTNIPDIDGIGLMRSTKSPGLYAQMCGRGTRMSPGKENCLVLDFGDNVMTHGPIDKIVIINPKNGKSENLGAPVRECPECHSLVHISSRFCQDCGYMFPENPRHNETASELNIISEKLPPEIEEIYEVRYSRHSKEGKPDSMRVEYFKAIGRVICSEFICLEHGGYATRKAQEWIKNRTEIQIETVDELLEHCEKLSKPDVLIVDRNEKYPKIIDYKFNSLTAYSETG